MKDPYANNAPNDTYPIVGRIDDINLNKYTVSVHGRNVIDYEKIKNEDPDLYKKVIDNENKPDPYMRSDLENL